MLSHFNRVIGYFFLGASQIGLVSNTTAEFRNVQQVTKTSVHPCPIFR